MTKTEHYQLNQWDASDYVRREDFNEDNRKIEEALSAILAGCSKIAVGEYDGEASNLGYGEGCTQDIALGFRPKALFVTTNTSFNSATSAMLFGTMSVVSDNKVICEITDSGFTVGTGKYQNSTIYPELNSKYQHYYYFAVS